MRTELLRAAWLLLLASAAYCSTSSAVPHGYSYVGQQAVSPGRSLVPQKPKVAKASSGYVANLSSTDLKIRSHETKQRSVDKEHDTILFTNEGHVYTKRLELPHIHQEPGAPFWKAPPTPEAQKQIVSQQQRQLLQTTSGSSLNPTLACEGCPSTDTRTRVTDTTQYPWTAVGMVTRTQSNQISSEVVQCSGTLIGTGHVLTAGHCVVNTDSGEIISGMQFWPAYNGDDEPFSPIDISRTRVLSRFANQTEVSTSSLNYDFALLTLKSTAPAGTAELAVVAGVGEQTYDLVTAGYPGDKTPQGSMWTTNCDGVVFEFAGSDTALEGCGEDCDNMVQHSCLTYEGQSGSGMWSSNNQTIHSIVTGAITIDNNDNLNVGIQMNAFVYNTIAGWYNEDQSEALPLTPAPPSAPASHHSTDSGESWLRSHIFAVIVPAVAGGIVGLMLLCCLISCLRRCCGRPKQRPVVGPAGRVPPAYPVGPSGTYASQYAQYSHQPPQYQMPQAQPPRPPVNASPFAQSFYNNGDPAQHRW